MEPIVIGIIGFVVLLILLGLGMHIAFAMGLVGIFGCIYFLGFQRAMDGIISLSPFSSTTSYTLTAIPLFILMGNIAYHSGVTVNLFHAAAKWLGKLPCGLGCATVAGCGAFAGITGSSVATAATMGTIAIPEMRRHGYDAKFACGCVAAGGTLGILIPPSTSFIVFGFLTETSVGKLFIAGIIPGIISVILYIAMMVLLPKLQPGIAPPKTEAITWAERFRSLTKVWPMLMIFLFLIGGIGVGWFTATEAGGMGVLSVIVTGLLLRQLSFSKFAKALLDTGRTTAMIMAIIVCAMLFGRFMAIARASDVLLEAVGGLSAMPLVIACLFVFLFLGTFMDNLAIHVLTIPIIWPLFEALGISPLWFGVLVVKATEVSLITPPVGFNVYVISGVAKDVPLDDIFRGIVPFLIMDIITIAILVAFPQISQFLPSIMR